MVMATLIAGLVFGFVTGWTLTLVLLATFPALAIAGTFFMWVIESKDRNEQKAYSRAGGKTDRLRIEIKVRQKYFRSSFCLLQITMAYFCCSCHTCTCHWMCFPSLQYLSIQNVGCFGTSIYRSIKSRCC